MWTGTHFVDAMNWLSRVIHGRSAGRLLRPRRRPAVGNSTLIMTRVPPCIYSRRASAARIHSDSYNSTMNAGVQCCTSRQHNTHISESKEVLYRWHPWCGRTVWIFGTVERKNAETVLRCALEPFETARLLEVPQWMFDPVACCRVTSATSPAVNCEALRELKRLLAQRPRAGQDGVVQAEHHPLPRTGGADATPDKSATGRSTRPVPSFSEDTTMGAPAARGPAADSAFADATAEATPSRRAGGAR